ncbi:DEAD/DEAH box helicase [Glaciibacter psychrotolerans]|uniref:Superfamily II DNA or RNA helicase n=1 Tax=Glaciibacter psychrotolerans TaxID=670054 RepID=A0A7Z0EHU4_9MICO|nr:DEAD/DEAH box helicase [Leifsonia psychrotolerans]NYJ21182.1 superfamily II DNA or RNA helicase [Leifsonia psychrotolerans]
MHPRLGTHEIARLVGSQAFSRGERYARNGNVLETTWFGDGTQLFATVAGSGTTPYSVTVTFSMTASGAVARASGVCTCPMKGNCKHVAAVLVASLSLPETDADGATTTSSGTTAAPVAGRVGGAAGASVAATPTLPSARPKTATSRAAKAGAEPIPAWQRQLAPLAQPALVEHSTGSPLALQFEVLEPSRSTRFLPGRPAHHLGVRPMVMGKQGKWIRGNLNWTNLAYARGSFNPIHQKILGSLYALFSAGQSYYVHIEQWMHLDDFGNRALWDLLAEARAAGLPFITTARDQSEVVLSTQPATVAMDISRTDTGLCIAPALDLPDHALLDAPFGFIGQPAHGVFSWRHADARLGSQAGTQLTLAPLAQKVDTPLRRLLSAPDPILVPTSDESDFLAGYYPFLRRQVALTCRDGSFQLPATAQPQLVLDIRHRTDAAITLRWNWHYIAPPAVVDGATDVTAGTDLATGTDVKAGTDLTADTDVTADAHDARRAPATPASVGPRLPLREASAGTDYRDVTRETEILRELAPLLAPFDTLHEQHAGRTRLAEHSSLTGARMIEFLDATVSELTASGNVVVQLPDDGPHYREADEAPVISLATSERADDRDWFDLAVTVSIEGEEIPFDDLFRALATEQELLILGSGTWFSLDRPELVQLRHLIEEARGLQDSHADSLGISRFQTDLWAELQELGLVAAQAAAWRHAVEGLTDATQVASQKLPDSVHATLRTYQQSGFDWLSYLYDNQLGGILADDMGLGKTLQTIALVAYARDKQRATQLETGAECAPFLVVAPTSVVPNWAAECRKFAPDLTVVTITETTAKSRVALAEAIAEADIVISSYTLFRLDFEEYNAETWAGLLLDEAQFVKNHQSRAHLCARRLRTPFKLAITGTPLENNLMEFWSLTSITAPGLFPSPSRFADYYQKPIEKDADAERLGQLRRRIRPFMLRRTKDQVATDLPAKQEQVLELELHPKHRKVYQMHLQRERQKVLGLIDDMNQNRFEIFRSLTMLRQLSLDASLYDEKYADIPSTKLDALLELLEDVVAEGHRTLIFSQFTQYLGKARERLDAAGITYSYLDGKTRNRAKAIADFKDGTASVFLISLKAGGFGLNLTEADYCILLDPWWNPATEAQAVDRAHRIGQTKNVMVYRLVSKDTIEEKVMALKATKARLFESVMTDGAVQATGLTASDIRELLA